MSDTPGDIHRVQTSDGPMWVFKSDVFVSRALATYGEYCAAETDMFRQLVHPGQTVVEAGANLGSHSVFLARRCAPGPFYAFEPQPRVFQVLCANLVINGVTNAFAYPEALGREEGETRIAISEYSQPGNFGGAAIGQSADAPSIRVHLRTLDSLELPACHFLKIDVEGWERDVLEGATQTIKRCRPIIYAENDRAKSQASLIDVIASMEYRLYWHVAMLFRPDNFNRVTENIIGNIASINMLCVPRESSIQVTGLELIEPGNWRSPIKPIQ